MDFCPRCPVSSVRLPIPPYQPASLSPIPSIPRDTSEAVQSLPSRMVPNLDVYRKSAPLSWGNIAIELGRSFRAVINSPKLRGKGWCETTQPRTKQIRPPARDDRTGAPVALRPHTRLRDPRPIRPPPTTAMVGLHLRHCPAHRTRKPQRLQLVEGPVGADLGLGLNRPGFPGGS